MTEEQDKADERWCENGEDRYGEYGVIGAEQADETHYDDRFIVADDGESSLSKEEEEEDDYGADGRIRFAKEKLYGREEELAQLRELFQANEASAIFVSGYSGCGKSRVVEEFILQNSTTTRDGKSSILFLRSKSEAIQASVPFSSISGLFDSIDKSITDEFVAMRDDIQNTLGNDCRLILKVFPKLEKFLGKGTISDSHRKSFSCSESVSISISSSSAIASAKKQETKRRMMLALQVFFRMLSSGNNSKSPDNNNNHRRRLCLFLDDLQWADSLSMELIESLLTDNTIENLFFFGGYRSNIVDQEHILMKRLQTIQEKRDEKEIKGYLCIELKQLRKEAIGQFIADSLRLTFEETLPLTNAVYTKTLGNPFFTRQALEYLVLKNALYYDTISFRWDWKLQENELKDLISDDLLDMIKVKIEHLEPKLQEVLMTASCTRSTFDIETILVLLHPKFLKQGEMLLEMLFETQEEEEEYKEEKKRLKELLNEAVVEGLLVQPQAVKRIANTRYSFRLSSSGEATADEYAFAHDKIQETARGLICSARNEHEFLEGVGNTLSQRAQSLVHGEDWMFFTACEHLNKVSEHYKSVSEHQQQKENKADFMDKENQFRLATLNLRTAELSMDLHSFPAALDYCEHGISYLPATEDERWSEKYHDTTLHLYSIAAQAKYGVGDIEEAERYCNLVISQRSGANPKVTTVEAVPVFLIFLDIALEKKQKVAGLELCMEILKEFGIKAPRNMWLLRAKVWMRLKRIKRRYLPTEDSIQNMPQIMDPIVANKMELMKRASTLAFASDATYLYMLLNIESVKHISRHGLTESSATSMASFANVMMHIQNDFKTSPKLAELAIHMADRQQSKFSETQPLNTANHNVLGWVRPLASRLKYHERAYHSGIASGNINGAMFGKYYFLQGKFYSCSATAQELEAELQAAIVEMRGAGQDFIADLAVTIRQLLLNLIGTSGNPNTTILTGEAMDENTELYQKQMPQRLLFGPRKSFALLFFGDFEGGAEDALKRGDEFSESAVGLMYGFESILRAIPLLIVARSGSEHKTKCRKSGTKLLKRVRRWVKNGCVNLVGLHQLMEAEFMALKKNSKEARSYFEMAIACCRNQNFHHFAGLSCELYAAYLSELGDSKGEKMYLQGAIDNYMRWGCTRKVDMLKKRFAE